MQKTTPVVAGIVFALVLAAAGSVIADDPGASVAIADQAPLGEDSPAQGLFLLARRGLPDPNFRQSVVFLLRHGTDGTLGLIVNRRTGIKLSEAIPQVKGVQETDHTLYFGGPVARDRIMFLTVNDAPVEASEHVAEGVYYSGNRELLESLLGKDTGKRGPNVYAGHAGWAAGQLAAELSRGDWYLVRADTEIIFREEGIESLWQNLIEQRDPEGILVLRRNRANSAVARPMLSSNPGGGGAG